MFQELKQFSLLCRKHFAKENFRAHLVVGMNARVSEMPGAKMKASEKIPVDTKGASKFLSSELGFVVAEGTLENWRMRHYGPKFMRVSSTGRGGRIRYLLPDLRAFAAEQVMDPSEPARETRRKQRENSAKS